jgi:hypothetical protein
VVYPSLGVTLQTVQWGIGNTYLDSLTPAFTCDTTPNCISTSLTGNDVTLNTGGSPDPVHVFGAFNFQDTTAPSGNQVTVTGGTVNQWVYGAVHWLRSNGNAQANDNTVTVSGGTLNGNGAWGAAASSTTSGDATASNNRVTVSAGTVNQIQGGDAFCNSASCTATADNNRVDIQGGVIGAGNVWGGFAQSVTGTLPPIPPLPPSGTAYARNNIVAISGTPDMSAAWLYGGVLSNNADGASSDNLLQVTDTAGLSARGLSDFQQLSFTLPATLTPATPVLTLSDAAQLGTNIEVTVSAAGGLTVNEGDVFTLIDAVNPITGSVAAASQSGTLLGQTYTLGIDPADNTRLILTIAPLAPAASAAAVPTLGQWGAALLALLLGAFALRGARRRG